MVNTRSTEQRLDILEKAVADIKLKMSTFDAQISKCIEDALAPFWRDIRVLGLTWGPEQHDSCLLGDQHSSHINNTESHNLNTRPTSPLLLPPPAQHTTSPPTRPTVPTSPLQLETQPIQQHVALPRWEASSIPIDQHKLFQKSPITPPTVTLPPFVSPAKLLPPSPLPVFVATTFGPSSPDLLLFQSPSLAAFIGASCWRSFMTHMTTKQLDYEWLLSSPTTGIPKQCTNVVGRFLLLGNLDHLRKHEYEPPPVKGMC